MAHPPQGFQCVDVDGKVVSIMDVPIHVCRWNGRCRISHPLHWSGSAKSYAHDVERVRVPAQAAPLLPAQLALPRIFPEVEEGWGWGYCTAALKEVWQDVVYPSSCNFDIKTEGCFANLDTVFGRHHARVHCMMSGKALILDHCRRPSCVRLPACLPISPLPPLSHTHSALVYQYHHPFLRS